MGGKKRKERERERENCGNQVAENLGEKFNKNRGI